ncbi:MAG TPA: RNA polymerase sigma factor [Candidatus Angelobacter sp.]|nr:RNA polymerase sigma factor [Candidatus Angelobacter sp.]
MKGSDQAGWADAFAQHSDAVYHLALVVLRNAEDARDAMQTAFERAWQHRNRYDTARPMRSWLLAIASHEAISLARRRRVRAALTLHDSHPAAGPPAQVSLELWEAIGSLPASHRAVVALFYLHGFSIEEIAALLDVPAGTVGSRLHTARRRLREMLTSDAPQEVPA